MSDLERLAYMAVILRYFSEFDSFRRTLRKMIEDIPTLAATEI